MKNGLGGGGSLGRKWGEDHNNLKAFKEKNIMYFPEIPSALPYSFLWTIVNDGSVYQLVHSCRAEKYG